MFLRWTVGLTLAVSLLAAAVTRGPAVLPSGAWIRSAMAPRSWLTVTFWFVLLVAIPWHLVDWRPRSLSLGVEPWFVGAKLVLVAVAMAAGWALVLRAGHRSHYLISHPRDATDSSPRDARGGHGVGLPRGRRRHRSPQFVVVSGTAIGATRVDQRRRRRLAGKVHRDTFLHPLGAAVERRARQHMRQFMPQRRLDRAALAQDRDRQQVDARAARACRRPPRLSRLATEALWRWMEDDVMPDGAERPVARGRSASVRRDERR